MEKNFLYYVQRRIANTSVGSSTVRGQPKKTVQSIRYFLKEIDLSRLSKIEDDYSFKKELDNLTDDLLKNMPNGKFGFARKCLNIFLFEASHNIFLSNHYGLNKVIPYLEVPLDNPNQKILKSEKKKKGFVNWDWKSIRSLDAINNKLIQEYAKDFMKENHNLDRVYFDLYYWRNKEDLSKVNYEEDK